MYKFHQIMFVIQKILEIGSGSGNNLQYFPRNCLLTSLDCNSYFEKYFLENKSNFPHITLEKFIIESVEDMTQIEDHSFDVVVATYLLCSVRDRRKALEEIQRVLKEVSFVIDINQKEIFTPRLVYKIPKFIHRAEHIFSWSTLDILLRALKMFSSRLINCL